MEISVENRTKAGIQHWINQIERTCATTHISNINLVLDQAGNTPAIIQELKRFQPAISWCSLLENEPENAFLEDAPLFIQIQMNIWQHKEWFHALLRQFSEPSRVLLLFSPYSFEHLAKQLQQLVIGEWEGRKGVLRFYDTRMFPLLLKSILSAQQRNYLLDIALLWSWRNRDGDSVWLPGSYIKGRELPQNSRLTLDDRQFDLLGYISDIELFYKARRFDFPQYTHEEFFQLLWRKVPEIMQQPLLAQTDDVFMQYLLQDKK
ncbi:DUF4123 domain-containing protein [Serratia sp. L9]|uniref:DUF4123 domain-containing protein n=1 Tax=Serratia sp. L9 TaxID=3423946 RepID=UPI003D66C951